MQTNAPCITDAQLCCDPQSEQRRFPLILRKLFRVVLRRSVIGVNHVRRIPVSVSAGPPLDFSHGATSSETKQNRSVPFAIKDFNSTGLSQNGYGCQGHVRTVCSLLLKKTRQNKHWFVLQTNKGINSDPNIIT